MSEEVIVVEAEEVEPIINEYEKYEINKTMAVDLAKGLPSIIKERENLLSQVDTILALDKDDPKTAKKAAELRKQIKNNRTQGFEKWRKTTKEVYLRAGQFIDALGKREIFINEQAEDKLEMIEKHAENLEKQRLEALQDERKMAIAPYVDENFSYPDLSNMDQEVFEAYLSTKKSSFEAKIAAEKKAEEEILERERIQNLHNERFQLLLPYWQFVSEEDSKLSFGELTQQEFESLLTLQITAKTAFDTSQEKIRQENLRLKEEADKRESEAKKQREAQEAALAEERRKAQELADKERKEKETLEAQLKKERDEKAEEETKKQAELEVEMLRKENLAKAGDKAILLDWVTKSFPTPNRPDGLTEAGNAKVLELVQKYDGFRNWALKQIEV
jgi:hypothetical protein